MNLQVLTILSLSSIYAAISSSLADSPLYPTIKELNTKQYLGRWYNLFANENIARLFTGNKCVVGDYGVVPNRSDAITVRNSAQINYIGFKFHTDGFATQSPNASG